MKSLWIRLSALLFLALSPTLAPAAEAVVPADSQAIRQEFDALFAASPIYAAIRKNLPESYEEFFRSYLEAKRTGQNDLQIARFVNAVRNTYLKQSSDETLLAFFRYTVEVGKEILGKDPEAAFAYIFGGDPGAYATYIDFAAEQKKIGQLYEQMLSTRAAANLAAFDPGKAAEGLDYVNTLLYFKYGEKFQLLKKDLGTMTGDERQRLCTIYLDLFDQVFQLAPETRNNVLRSFASRMG